MEIKQDFIKNKLAGYLQDNIISKEILDHLIWEKLNIQVTELNADERQKHNQFDFAKAILPSGWKLQRGCPCDKNIIWGTFNIIDNSGDVLECLLYFPTIFDEIN